MRKLLPLFLSAVLLLVCSCGRKGPPSPRRDLHNPGPPSKKAAFYKGALKGKDGLGSRDAEVQPESGGISPGTLSGGKTLESAPSTDD